MQRVVSINLDGNAYQVEENGYNALFAYLDAFEAALKESPERAQKLADLERTIAARCQGYLGPHKNVVTSAEIDRLLVELEPAPGQPAAAPAAAPSSSSSTSSNTSGSTKSPDQTSPNPSSHSYSHRKLFQIRDGAMISGVCVGLSEYMHIDVTLIRILFVIFALASAGWGILAYAVLMFVVPKVDTRAQASAGAATGTHPPHHWPWDDGWPWDKYGWPWDHPTPDQHKARAADLDPRQQRADARDQRREWRDERRAARMAHHPWSPMGTIMMIVFLMFGFFWLSFWTRGHFFFGWPFFWGFPHWFGIIFFFLMLRLIFMPFRAARWYGYGPYGYAHPHYAWAAMWNGLAWFMVMIFAVWLAYHYIPDVHNLIRDFHASWHDDFNV